MLEHKVFNILRQRLSFYQTLKNEHIDVLIASTEYIDNTVSFARSMLC